MPNSTAQLNATLQILDNLGVSAIPLLNRVVPPLACQSSSVAIYSGYTYVAATGTPLTIVSAPAKCLFLFVRCVNGGPLILGFTPGATLVAVNMTLLPGGIFFYGNTAIDQNDGGIDYVTSVGMTASLAGQQGTFEYLAAY
jgi:hypothetical protein